MDRFNAIGRGMQLMLVGSVLLLITTFFNWQEMLVRVPRVRGLRGSERAGTGSSVW